MDVLRLKVKPAPNKKQVLLITDSGIYSRIIECAPGKADAHKKPKK